MKSIDIYIYLFVHKLVSKMNILNFENVIIISKYIYIYNEYIFLINRIIKIRKESLNFYNKFKKITERDYG